MKLSGNTILITGGGSGIGQALAISLAGMGNTVVVCGRRQNKLDETVEREPRIKAYCCDVTEPLAVENLRRKLHADEYKINVLINNAAILNYYNFSKPSEFNLDDAQQEINCNLTAPIGLTMALLPQLLEHPQPYIINVGSPGGLVAISPSPLYSASKAGLHAFTQVLRLHLKGKAKVIEVFPPTVATEMTTDLARNKVTSEQCVTAILAGLKKDSDEV
ncbi:MAG: putative oxidoreductase, partial [Bacteroidia bacterium]